MSRSKQVLGLSLLCATCLCAFGVASASATTQYECKQVSPEKTGTWTNQKCTEMSGTNEGEFQWVAGTPGKATVIKATQLKSYVFKTTIAGVKFRITCTKATAEANSTNEEVAKVMQNIWGADNEVFNGCTVSEPVTQNCKLPEEQLAMPNSKSTTFMRTEAETRVSITPTAGPRLGELTLEGCKISGLNGTYEIGGGIVAIPSGSNLSFTAQSSEEGGLTIGGKPATMEGESVLEVVMSKEEGGGTTATMIE